MDLPILTCISDILVAIAYFAIPTEMLYFYKRLTLSTEGFPAQFKQVLNLFVLFICFCGLTHVIMSIHPFHPLPVLNLLAKASTAFISLYTAYQMLIVIPRVLYYPIYTRNIEDENLQRQLHERYLQENINIFRQIREYTQTMYGQPVRSLCQELVSIFQKQLKVDAALYLAADANYKLLCKGVAGLCCPEAISLREVETGQVEGFRGHWWLLHFNSGESSGYVALKVEAKHTRMTTRRNLMLNGEPTIPLPEMEASITIDMTDKPYFADIIFDILEHFESNLAQAEAREKNESLIAALTRKNDALNKSRIENQQLAKESRDWLSVMSHEMRTPLFAIQSLSELVLEKIDQTDQESISSLKLINSSSQHLSEIINNVLDFSKLEEQSEVHLDETSTLNIREVISESLTLNVRNNKRIYPQTCSHCDPDVPDELIADALRVKQIVLNLVSNAVKFTPDEGSVVVRTTVNRESESQGRLFVRVIDTGIGIRSEDRSKIFKEFSQSDATMTRKFGGSGLGLSICKRLCKLMGGDIDFKPNDPQGTEFYFDIVVRFPARQDVRNSVCGMILPSSVLNWKVLVADDLPATAEAVLCHLRDDIGIKNITIVTSPEQIQSGYDVYLINMRTHTIMKNQTVLEKLLDDHFGRVILQSNPYIKQFMPCQSSYEILGPVIPRELCSMIKAIAAKDGLLTDVQADVAKIVPLNLHILVAEDNAVNQTVLKQMLMKMKVSADFADNGQIAMTKYAENTNKYRVILMDIMMPIMDGYSTAKEIRKMSKSMHNPYIIALTANAFWEDKIRAIEAGMNDFVTKPTKFKTLYEALVKATGN